MYGPLLCLLQSSAFGLCSDEDGNVRVSIFPQREEILICRSGFGGVALLRIGSADLKMGQSADGVRDATNSGAALLVLSTTARRAPSPTYPFEKTRVR
jgi:hypothetical protein